MSFIKAVKVTPSRIDLRTDDPGVTRIKVEGELKGFADGASLVVLTLHGLEIDTLIERRGNLPNEFFPNGPKFSFDIKLPSAKELVKLLGNNKRINISLQYGSGMVEIAASVPVLRRENVGGTQVFALAQEIPPTPPPEVAMSIRSESSTDNTYSQGASGVLKIEISGLVVQDKVAVEYGPALPDGNIKDPKMLWMPPTGGKFTFTKTRTAKCGEHTLRYRLKDDPGVSCDYTYTVLPRASEPVVAPASVSVSAAISAPAPDPVAVPVPAPILPKYRCRLTEGLDDSGLVVGIPGAGRIFSVEMRDRTGATVPDGFLPAGHINSSNSGAFFGVSRVDPAKNGVITVHGHIPATVPVGVHEVSLAIPDAETVKFDLSVEVSVIPASVADTKQAAHEEAAHNAEIALFGAPDLSPTPSADAVSDVDSPGFSEVQPPRYSSSGILAMAAMLALVFGIGGGVAGYLWLGRNANIEVSDLREAHASIAKTVARYTSSVQELREELNDFGKSMLTSDEIDGVKDDVEILTGRIAQTEKKFADVQTAVANAVTYVKQFGSELDKVKSALQNSPLPAERPAPSNDGGKGEVAHPVPSVPLDQEPAIAMLSARIAALENSAKEKVAAEKPQTKVVEAPHAENVKSQPKSPPSLLGGSKTGRPFDAVFDLAQTDIARGDNVMVSLSNHGMRTATTAFISSARAVWYVSRAWNWVLVRVPKTAEAVLAKARAMPSSGEAAATTFEACVHAHYLEHVCTSEPHPYCPESYCVHCLDEAKIHCKGKADFSLTAKF